MFQRQQDLGREDLKTMCNFFFTEFLSLAYYGVLRTNIMRDDVEHPMREFIERWSTNN